MEDQIKEVIEYKELDINDYSTVHDLYDALEYDGSLHEIVDGMIDIYYHDIREWAVDNYDYVEQAISDGLTDTENPDFHKQIQAGQYVFYSEQMNEDLQTVFDELTEEAEAS